MSSYPWFSVNFETDSFKMDNFESDGFEIG